MEYLHQKLDLKAGDAVEVYFDHAANVQLLDPGNFESYRNRRPYRYHGGFVTQTPYLLEPPRPGEWHLVIDLGGNAGRVRAWSRVVRGELVDVGEAHGQAATS